MMLLVVLGSDTAATDVVGARLAAALGWPFYELRPAADVRDAFIEEMTRDLIHAEDVHGSRVVASWHLGILSQAMASGRATEAAAILAHLRSTIDWFSVFVLPVTADDEPPPAVLGVARALGAYLGRPLALEDLPFALPSVVAEVVAASNVLGTDDVMLGFGAPS